MNLDSYDDYVSLLFELLNPLKPFYSKECARVRFNGPGAVYDQNAIEMEAFARPLWGLSALWKGGYRNDDFHSLYCKGIINGTDPSFPEYWGNPSDNDQRFVEMAPIAVALLSAPDLLWNPLSMEEDPDFKFMASEQSADKFNEFVKGHYDRYERNLQDDKKVGEAYRQYVLLNLKMNELVVLGKKGAMPGIVKSPYFRYGYDYTTYLEYMERDKGQVVDLWEDVKKAREVYQNFVKEHRFSSDDKKLMKTITQPEIQKYVKERAEALEAQAALAQSNKSFVIAELDKNVSGADILPSIISSYRGQAVLIDFWATWCGPCRKSMFAIRDLKKKLASKDIVYIYLTGPSSPEAEWKTAITDIKGVHYRLKKEQWDYLCQTYGIKAIPGYLVISYDGKLQDQYTGFPGTDVLMKDLLRASE